MGQLNVYFQDWSSFFHFISNREVGAPLLPGQKALRIPFLGQHTVTAAIAELEAVSHFRSIRLKLKAFVKCRTIITTGIALLLSIWHSSPHSCCVPCVCSAVGDVVRHGGYWVR